jgi:hypothetical protein
MLYIFLKRPTYAPHNASEFHFRTKSTGCKVRSSHSHKTAVVFEKESSTGAPSPSTAVYSIYKVGQLAQTPLKGITHITDKMTDLYELHACTVHQ